MLCDNTKIRYVNRDKDGAIVSVFSEPQTDDQERISVLSKELQKFLTEKTKEQSAIDVDKRRLAFTKEKQNEDYLRRKKIELKMLIDTGVAFGKDLDEVEALKKELDELEAV